MLCLGNVGILNMILTLWGIKQVPPSGTSTHSLNMGNYIYQGLSSCYRRIIYPATRPEPTQSRGHRRCQAEPTEEPSVQNKLQARSASSSSCFPKTKWGGENSAPSKLERNLVGMLTSANLLLAAGNVKVRQRWEGDMRDNWPEL